MPESQLFGQTIVDLLVKNEPIQTSVLLLKNKSAKELVKQLYAMTDALDRQTVEHLYFALATKIGLLVIPGITLYKLASKGSMTVFDSVSVTGQLTGYLLIIQLPFVYSIIAKQYDLAFSLEAKQLGRTGKATRYTIDLIVHSETTQNDTQSTCSLFYVEVNGLKYDLIVLPNRSVFDVTFVDKGPVYILKSEAYDRFSNDSTDKDLSVLLAIEANTKALTCLQNSSTKAGFSRKAVIVDSMLAYVLDKEAKHRFLSQQTDKQYVLLDRKLIVPAPVFKASHIGTLSKNQTEVANTDLAMTDFEFENFTISDVQVDEADSANTETAVFDSLQDLVDISDVVSVEVPTDVAPNYSQAKQILAYPCLYNLSYVDIQDYIEQSIKVNYSAVTVLYDVPILKPELHGIVIANKIARFGSVWFVDMLHDV